MICYLPFTEITQHFDILSKAFGSIIIYGPFNSVGSEQMRIWQQQGLLDLRTPLGLDDDQIMRTLGDYKNWAQLHDGHIGDMVQFFHTNHGRPPLMDENAPSQIKTQIRKHGQDDSKEPDPILQAALFLALAQEYDQHQERFHQEMGRVADMERSMYATMGNDKSRENPLNGQARIGRKDSFPRDLGAHMTDRRIKAWAQIAFQDTQQSRIFVTPSPAIFEHLKALKAKTIELAVWYLSPQGDSESLKQSRLEAIEEMSQVEKLDALSLNPDLSGLRTEDAVPLVLVGWRGSLFESISAKCFAESQHSQGQAQVLKDSLNTIIGLVGNHNDTDEPSTALPL